MAKIFLDSSVIIAGINSTTGASNFILKLSRDKEIESFVSDMVIQEVVRNIKKKLPEEILIKFLKYLAESNFKKVEFEEEYEVLKYQNITVEKDVHIIAAAGQAKVDYLITLDKKHLLNLKQKLPFRIITPGELLKSLETLT